MHLKTTLAAGMLCVSAAPAASQDLNFMAGSPGGSFYPMAAAIASALGNVRDDVNVQVLPGNGVQNVIGVATGLADIGLSNPTTTVEGIEGRGDFPEAYGNLCNAAALYPQYLQIVTTRTHATEFGDLAGTRMATLSPGSTSEAVFREFQTLYDLTDDDFEQVAFGSGSDQATFIRDGQADGTFLITAAPSGIIVDIANARDVVVLPIGDDLLARLRNLNAGWSRLTIPAGTYEGQSEDIPVAGFPLHVVVPCDMDDELAADIAEAIHTHTAELGSVNSYMANATLDTISMDVGVPMHPAAAAYYESARN